MDLPTYTSIWRIEKRLYKLYDFRLPMPLPIGQITVFAAIAVPYVVLLTIAGLPFNHTLVWLYVLPPGAATWLVTRPVLEGKRLPELIKSQVRYLAEPRVWCRMAPLAESDVIVVTGRVWRLSEAARAKTGRRRVRARRVSARRAGSDGHAGADRQPVRSPVAPKARRTPAPARPVVRGHAGVFDRPAALLAGRVRTTQGTQATQQYAGLLAPPARRETATPIHRPIEPYRPAERYQEPGGRSPAAAALEPRRPVRSPTAPPTRPALAAPEARPIPPEARPIPPEARPTQPAPPSRPDHTPSTPVVTVVNAGSGAEAPPALETALAGPGARRRAGGAQDQRGDGRADRVTVVPGGHRPGKPDQLQRDRTRARSPISGHRRVVVLGCTVGAGQTAITLLAGEVLASLRSEPVAVLDLNPGAESLAQQVGERPALGQATSLGPSRLAVLTAHGEPDRAAHPEPDPAQALAAFERAIATHQIVLADPSTTAVTRLLTIADQLVLVAPASAAAARAIVMTFEWLDAHAHGSLAADSIMVMNGVSRRSMPHVEQAERTCVGRCRAIVRVPWDDQLKTQVFKRTSSTQSGLPAGQQWTGLLSPATVSACTALAGVLVATLAGSQGRVPR